MGLLCVRLKDSNYDSTRGLKSPPWILSIRLTSKFKEELASRIFTWLCKIETKSDNDLTRERRMTGTGLWLRNDG